MRGSFQVVLVTAPDAQCARRLARGLVESKLAACVNVVPGLASHYRWKGRLCEDKELLLVIKTKAALFARLARFVREIHPARVPEIIALPLAQGSADYLAWLAESTR